MRCGARKRAGERGNARRGRGFTFIETLVVCALMLLLAALAVPSFAAWQQRQRVETGVRTLLASMAYARSEAVRVGAPVVICRSDANGRCGDGGQFGRERRAVDWAAGWAVVLETDHGRQVLRTHFPASGVQIRGAPNVIRFRPPAGQVIGGFRSFEFAPFGAGSGEPARIARRCVSVAAGGRARVSDGDCRSPA